MTCDEIALSVDRSSRNRFVGACSRSDVRANSLVHHAPHGVLLSPCGHVPGWRIGETRASIAWASLGITYDSACSHFLRRLCMR